MSPCWSFAGSKQPVHLLSTSEDGQWLAAANTGCEIHVYNLRKLKVFLKDGQISIWSCG